MLINSSFVETLSRSKPMRGLQLYNALAHTSVWGLDKARFLTCPGSSWFFDVIWILWNRFCWVQLLPMGDGIWMCTLTRPDEANSLTFLRTVSLSRNWRLYLAHWSENWDNICKAPDEYVVADEQSVSTQNHWRLSPWDPQPTCRGSMWQLEGL